MTYSFYVFQTKASPTEKFKIDKNLHITNTTILLSLRTHELLLEYSVVLREILVYVLSVCVEWEGARTGEDGIKTNKTNNGVQYR